MGKSRKIWLNIAGTRWLCIHPPGGDHRAKELRKMVECIFHDTNIESHIYAKQQTKVYNNKNLRGRTTNAIIVSEEGKLYPNLLRTVKNQINEHLEKANCTKCIRQTKDEKVLIEMKSADQTTTEGIRNVVTKSRKSKARISSGPRERNIQLHIKGVDSVTIKGELTEAIERGERESEGGQQQINIKSVKCGPTTEARYRSPRMQPMTL